jgi:hypothetical protein
MDGCGSIDWAFSLRWCFFEYGNEYLLCAIGYLLSLLHFAIKLKLKFMIQV